MIILHDYQKKAIDDLRFKIKQNKRSVLILSPTGSGKTVIISELCKLTVERKKRVLVITHRKELLDQLKKTIKNDCSKITSDTKYMPNSSIVVGMVETIHRRILTGWAFDDFTLVIIDEAHEGSFKKIHQNFKEKSFVIGATATTAMSKKTDKLSNYYEDLVFVNTIKNLIDNNFLAKPKYLIQKAEITAKVERGEFNNAQLYADFNRKYVYQNLLDQINEHDLREKKGIIFCVNISHANKVYMLLKEAGHSAFLATSDMHDTYRSYNVSAYKACKTGFMVNCGILTTGFDDPETNLIVIMRATTSISLYYQMCGRGSRITENKKDFVILDMGNNCTRLGYWHNEPDWEKIFWNGIPKSKSKQGIPPSKLCDYCNALNHVNSKVCSVCAKAFPEKEKKRIEIITEMINYEDEKISEDFFKSEAERLVYTQLKNKYKPSWLVNELMAKGSSREMIEEVQLLKGYKENWFQSQIRYKSQMQKNIMTV